MEQVVSHVEFVEIQRNEEGGERRWQIGGANECEDK